MARRDKIILPHVGSLDRDPLYRLAGCREWLGPDDPPPPILDLNGGRVSWFFAVGGIAHLERGGRRHLLEAGSVLLTDDTQRDRLLLPPSPSGRWLQVSLSGAVALRYHRHLRHRFGFLHVVDPRSVPVRMAFALARIRPAEACDVFTVSRQIYAWLNALDRHLERHHAPMHVLLRMSPDDLADSPLLSHTLESLARDLGVSRAVLSQLLSRQWGEPPGRVLRRLRLAKARRLVLTTALTVEDVARKVGFSGARALILAFRRHFRTTPGALRTGRKGTST